MEFGELFDYGEAEPRSSVAAVRRLPCLSVAFEDAFPVFLGNADAVVGDRYDDGSEIGRASVSGTVSGVFPVRFGRREYGTHVDRSPGMRVLDGVVDEVFEYAAKLLPIGHRERDVGIGPCRQRDVLVLGNGFERVFDEADQVDEIDGFGDELVFMGFGLRDGEDVVHHVQQQRCIRLDLLDGVARFVVERIDGA